MGSQNVLLAMASSPRTVFTLQSLMVLTGNYDRDAVIRSLYYYRKQGLVFSPRSGIYTKKEYSSKELACSIFTPSYISLNTVLAEEGVIFQYSSEITVISALSRRLDIDGRCYDFRRIDPVTWADMKGIRQEDGYCIACPERALLDMMYLYHDIGYFDNVNRLDFGLIAELAASYRNMSFENRVKKWIETNMPI